MYFYRLLRVFIALAGAGFYSLLLVNPALAHQENHDNRKIVIAHRGASAYLPEHTLAGKAMAYAMGADYLEQDLVMTKDNRLVVLHDHFLDKVTNVRTIFPGRARKDGRYYVIDFTLAELRKLNVIERFNMKAGKRVAVFSDRFPLGKSRFGIHTFGEEIELIQGLNKSTGKNVGIYPEIKSPAFHRKEGKDISRAILKVLKAYGYTEKSDKVYLQSFDAQELNRVRNVLFPEMGMNLKIIQLLPATGVKGNSYNKAAIRKIAKYADGIGPDKAMIVRKDSVVGNIKTTGLVRAAHADGMVVHPYTFRMEKSEIPPYAKNFTDLLNILLYQIGVDGVFSDYTDKTVAVIAAHNK